MKNLKSLTKELQDVLGEATFDSLVVKSGKGKKAKVDEEATLQNVCNYLAYARGVIDGAEVFAQNVKGADEVIENAKETFDELFAQAVDFDEEAIAAFSESALVSPFYGDEEEEEIEEDEETDDEEVEDDEAADEEEDAEESDEEEEESPYEGMTLGELRKEAKSRGITYSPKTKADELIALLEEDDEEAIDVEAEVEDEEEEESAYEGMSLGELRKEAKSRGIKVTPKMKADELIALLEEDDEAADEEEDAEEADDEDVSADELDAILDEEFENETIEEEEEKEVKAKGKKLPPKKKRK